jgi:hypothetical protein
VNPYAHQLTFLDDRTRTRRDHEKYLTLIDTIALLHQHQREVKTVNRGGKPIEYIEVTFDDIAAANALAHEVLGRSLDELPPQTRRLLLLIDEHVRGECKRQALTRSAYRFSRRGLREGLGWGDTQLKTHLARLVEMEYLAVHREGTGFAYELLYDGKGADGTPFVPGLIEVEQLKCTYDADRSEVNADRSGSSRPLVGPRSGDGRTKPTAGEQASMPISQELAASSPKSHSSRGNGQDRSYTQVPLAAASR